MHIKHPPCPGLKSYTSIESSQVISLDEQGIVSYKSPKDCVDSNTCDELRDRWFPHVNRLYTDTKMSAGVEGLVATVSLQMLSIALMVVLCVLVRSTEQWFQQCKDTHYFGQGIWVCIFGRSDKGHRIAWISTCGGEVSKTNGIRHKQPTYDQHFNRIESNCARKRMTEGDWWFTSWRSESYFLRFKDFLAAFVPSELIVFSCECVRKAYVAGSERELFSENLRSSTLRRLRIKYVGVGSTHTDNRWQVAPSLGPAFVFLE